MHVSGQVLVTCTGSGICVLYPACHGCQMAGMNARLAYVEGRQSELGPAWREALGVSGDLVAEIGPELAAAAGTKVVESELKAAAPDLAPLDLMQ